MKSWIEDTGGAIGPRLFRSELRGARGERASTVNLRSTQPPSPSPPRDIRLRQRIRSKVPPTLSLLTLDPDPGTAGPDTRRLHKRGDSGVFLLSRRCVRASDRGAGGRERGPPGCVSTPVHGYCITRFGKCRVRRY